MAHHAFFVEGNSEECSAQGRAYAVTHLNLTDPSSPDIVFLTFGLFSVDDARRIGSLAYQSSTSEQKVIIFYAARLFHEAQNALLKVFEEPPAGVTIILGVPSKGILLQTLRSRLMLLPDTGELVDKTLAAKIFLGLPKADKEKFAAKLIERSKADKDEVKQAARGEATELIQSLITYTHVHSKEEKSGAAQKEQQLFLQDLAAFIPLMFERSAPLKLIFEHLLLVIPTSLEKGKV